MDIAIGFCLLYLKGRLYLCFDRDAIINNQMPGVTCDKN